jgi:signal transduction histidine kinase
MPSERAQENQDLQSALRKAERANAALAVTIRSVAHELRTPLTAILGFTEMIMEKTFGPIGHPRYGEYIEHISFSANHLLFITENLLDIAQIEAGAQSLDEQMVGLDDLLESAIRLVTPQFQQNGVVLDRFRQLAPQRARVDEQRMRQVLVNLLSNAAKFTPSGGSVRAEITSGADGEITITVHDTGMGIAPEDIDKVIAPFGRHQVARTRQIEGTGLGLALSKAIVEAHGGRLVLTSQVGSGTSVSVHLPGYRSVDAPAAEPLPDPELFRSQASAARPLPPVHPALFGSGANARSR